MLELLEPKEIEVGGRRGAFAPPVAVGSLGSPGGELILNFIILFNGLSKLLLDEFGHGLALGRAK